VSELLEKIPPQNLEAEQSTLGSMMIDGGALEKGVEVLKPQDFYRDAHQQIFGAFVSLAGRNEPVDIRTLQEELRSGSRLDAVGGTEYLMALIDSVPTAANIEYYAEIVREKSRLRRLLDLLNMSTRAVYASDTTADEIAASLSDSGDGHHHKTLAWP